MFKLWLFGCSFSAQYSDQGYYKMLADKLNAELCINAYSGAGLGYLMYQSMKHRHEFAEDDYIIFQTTSLDRGFLSKENPAIALQNNWKSLSKKQKEGYLFYLLDIHDIDVLKTQFQAWLHGMAYYTKHLRVQPLLTTAWDLGDIELPHKWKQSKGILRNLSTGEFNVPDVEVNKWLESNGFDPRSNHFSTPNHYKIADMYYKALTDKNYIPDFNTLEQNIYNELPKQGMSPDEWIK
tara:strand:- start:153 stop:863 length:711 start_codon:yes stop_codon:yes gene_type:complete